MHRGVPAKLADELAGVRIEQQLGRVAGESAGGLPASVHPIAIAEAGGGAGQEAVPDVAAAPGQRNAPAFMAVVVEHAEFDGVRDRRGDREVNPVRVDAGAERGGLSVFHQRRGSFTGSSRQMLSL